MLRVGSVLLAATASAVGAQTTVGPAVNIGRTFSIEPRLSVAETLTDNIGLTTSNRQADLITEVTPGFLVTSNGGRVRGFLDYALTGLAYIHNSSSNTLLNALNAKVAVEAVEKWAFLDVQANISQQAISAFGTISPDPNLINKNRTEVRTLSISPYVTGRVVDFADYEARVTQIYTRDSETSTSDNDSTEALVRLVGPSSHRLFNWSADASGHWITYSGGRRIEDNRLRALLYATPYPELRFSLIGGYESNNYFSLEKQGESTPGLGVDWRPSERTRVSFQQERRFFGNSHSYLVEYRTPRTAWRYSDVSDVSTSFGAPTLGSQGTAYDLFFAQFASVQPDPVLRARLVNEFLLANGLSASTPIFSGSLTSAVTQERRQELSFALLGIRDTVVFSAMQTRSRRIDQVSEVIDDFSNGNVVRQRGFTVQGSHRLTPLSTINLVALVDRTSGNEASQSTTLRSISLIWIGQLAPRTQASLGARHSSFSSPVNPYGESAITARLTMRF